MHGFGGRSSRRTSADTQASSTWTKILLSSSLKCSDSIRTAWYNSSLVPADWTSRRSFAALLLSRFFRYCRICLDFLLMVSLNSSFMWTPVSCLKWVFNPAVWKRKGHSSFSVCVWFPLSTSLLWEANVSVISVFILFSSLSSSSNILCSSSLFCCSSSRFPGSRSGSTHLLTFFCRFFLRPELFGKIISCARLQLSTLHCSHLVRES